MTLTPHSVEYRHHGKTYVIEVYAENPQDAQDRIRSAYHNGTAQEVIARVSVPAFIGNMIGGQHG
ncbi:hypothetical protein UFOVP368_68 [uncultured Caudovirales phage]|uniref:Uncharacterized protein n=1 Tax=uncultured Caudovirales phage TaxID=2100421 RepID=A0A6J7WYH4_9CAUD|nr:hypothetical protein UFOVP368_68 [uncultured Caudovirales phage]